MPTVAIALGSNIDPERHLHETAQLLRARWPDIRFSRVYRTRAEGYEDQADFLNAAATFQTDESAETVMRALTEIEASLGKSVPFRWGPRTIDLDLLLYGDEVIDADGLTIPHARMHERRFVLEPLAGLLPNGRHPALGIGWGALRDALGGPAPEDARIGL